MKRRGNPVTTRRANNPLKTLLGSFCGCLKVCVISGFGFHLSGGDGFSGDDSSGIGLIDANWVFKGVESPNDAMIKDNLRTSAYKN